MVIVDVAVVVDAEGAIESIASVAGTNAIQKQEDYADSYVNLEEEIIKNKNMGSYPNLKYMDCPDVKKLMVLKSKLTIDVKYKSSLFNRLDIFSSSVDNSFPDPSKTNENLNLLVSFNIEDGEITNDIVKFELDNFVYTPEFSNKNYMYCRWRNSSSNLQSANSPMIAFYNSQD